jgi:hypothetical protein
MTNAATGLWETLRGAGLVAGAAPADTQPATAWYVNVMLGVTGWIAALLLIGFFGVALEAVFRSSGVAFAVGGALLVAAYSILRIAGTGAFVSQMGLAVSLAGQALVVGALYSELHSHRTECWLLIAALEAALAFAIPNFIHRVWSAYAAATALTISVAAAGAYFISAGPIAAFVALLWLNELRWAVRAPLLRPIAYGLTLALVQIPLPYAFGRLGSAVMSALGGLGGLPAWISELLVAGMLVFVVYRLLINAGAELSSRGAIVALAGTVLVGVISMQAPGIAVALMIALLGFAGGNRTLTGLGIAALISYVSAYYYALEVTLLLKSAVLAGTATVLLAARWAKTRLQDEDDADA